MNIENIRKVADTIEDHARRGEGLRGVGFNMGRWNNRATPSAPDHIDDCSTVACIAGWTELVFYRSLKDPRTILDLTAEQANNLFYGDGFIDDLRKITPRQAVAVLNNLADTGKVSWSPKVRGPR